MPTVPLEPAEAFQRAVSLLRGTNANHILCCVAMFCSLCFSVVGYVLMTEGNACSRALTLMAICYLVSQAFTLAKVSRDRMIVSGTRIVSSDLELLRPTPQYTIQVICFFFLALATFVYAIALLEIDSHWYGFTALAFIWVLVCIFCLTKSIRDRKDASIWAALDPASQPGQLQRVVDNSIGTLEYRMLVRASFAVSVVASLIWIWNSDLAIERKGFLSLALLFNATAGFHIAKLLRDLKDTVKARELRSQVAFMLMVVSSFTVSLIVPVVAICVMPLEIQQRLFLLVGQLMTSNTCLNLAKMVRDLNEQRALNERLPAAADLEAPAASDESPPVVVGSVVGSE